MQSNHNSSRTYVLIHGAHHGGWCWSRVTDRLHAAGHRVFAPSLTGAGERLHLLNESVDFNTYIEDVVQLFAAEELWDVILVGHSMGGRVIAGVADRIPEAIRHLVFLDAALPQAGKSMSGDSARWQERVKTARVINGAPCVDALPPKVFGVLHPPDQDWLRRRLTPMPVKAFETRLELRNPLCNGLPKTYMRCTRPAMRLVMESAAFAQQSGWRVVDLATGHDAMVSAPAMVCEQLLAVG